MFFFLLQDSNAATLILGVLLQELCRGAYLRLYLKAEHALAKQDEVHPPPLNDLLSSVAAGLGFGVMSSVVMYGSLLATSVSEAVLYSNKCSEMSLFALSGRVPVCWVCCGGHPDGRLLFGVVVPLPAVSSLLFTFLHILLSVLLLDGLRRHSVAQISVVVALHLVASLMVRLGAFVCLVVLSCHGAYDDLTPTAITQTLANETDGGCAYTPALVAVVVLVAGAGVWRVVTRADYEGARQAKLQAAATGGSAGGSSGAGAGAVAVSSRSRTDGSGRGGVADTNSGGDQAMFQRRSGSPNSLSRRRGGSAASSTATGGMVEMELVNA